ncbi:NAD(P)/FAD-dependent oxidoreductase [Cellulomonas sp. NPDC089187]|uniref:phytoene desaturase family protein n=1 Tax=Cellulomonas sp. NPDC089187 TaxID=3154970 RepID=UPI00341A5CC9
MTLDAVVVGSGPNGLAAAVTLARAGLDVVVLEEQSTVGGGSRTVDLGLSEGIVHDLCSAVHPMAWSSPFMRAIGIPERIELLTPEASFAHPLDGGRAAIAWHDLDRTVHELGPAGGNWWRQVIGALGPDAVATLLEAPSRRLSSIPAVARAAARLTLAPPTDPAAAALISGVAAHAIAPLHDPTAVGTAVLLAGLAHRGAGWPVPRGGSQAIVDALVTDLIAHGGRIATDHPVRNPADLPPARSTLFATAPSSVTHALGVDLPPADATRLLSHPYGPGAAAKVDLVVRGPVPWTDPRIGHAVTVHLGGGRGDLARAERVIAAGRHPSAPYVMFADPTVVDPGRRRGDLRPIWTYAHVPVDSTRDPLPMVLAQIERFAPGFRDTVVAAHAVPAARLSAHDSALSGGDIAGGTLTLRRLLAGPLWGRAPYRVGVDGVYLCSASEPPGPGVHGMAGYRAARLALREQWGLADPLSAS